jgi:uncharacterized protein YdeI (YjbR/CyaY-like superfamily)
MPDLRRIRPKSRKVWRDWLSKNHASSEGVWLVYAKKHSGVPSLTYNDAVEEALCFGWIDSKINPIDDDFYMQVFTPRKPKSAWSGLNKARVTRLMASGLMTPTGLAAIEAAKGSGAWRARDHVEELTIPPDLAKALKANRDASRHWASYSPSRRKAVLYRLAGAKRPETRARYLQEIIANMIRNLSSAERSEMAGFKPKPKRAGRGKSIVGHPRSGVGTRRH